MQKACLSGGTNNIQLSILQVKIFRKRFKKYDFAEVFWGCFGSLLIYFKFGPTLASRAFPNPDECQNENGKQHGALGSAPEIKGEKNKRKTPLVLFALQKCLKHQCFEADLEDMLDTRTNTLKGQMNQESMETCLSNMHAKQCTHL